MKYNKQIIKVPENLINNPVIDKSKYNFENIEKQPKT